MNTALKKFLMMMKTSLNKFLMIVKTSLKTFLMMLNTSLKKFLMILKTSLNVYSESSILQCVWKTKNYKCIDSNWCGLCIDSIPITINFSNHTKFYQQWLPIALVRSKRSPGISDNQRFKEFSKRTERFRRRDFGCALLCLAWSQHRRRLHCRRLLLGSHHRLLLHLRLGVNLQW